MAGWLSQGWLLVRMTVREVGHHAVTRMAAALAFFALFGIPPLLLLLLVVGGAVYGDEETRSGILDPLEEEMGSEIRDIVDGVIENTPRPGEGALPTQLLSMAALLLGATGIFHQLQYCLNSIWNSPKRRGWWAFVAVIVKRLITFALVAVSGLLLVAWLGISTVVGTLPDAVAALVPPEWAEMLSSGLEKLASFLILTFHFALVFKYLPDGHVPLRSVLIGAPLTALFLLIGKSIFELYLRHGDLGTAFGAAGSLVVLLVWIYAAALVVLFGACFTRAHARWRALLLATAR